MKLSTKGRYGLMAMFELALEYGKGSVPLKRIAENQDLSDNYLEQLFALLRKDKLITSVRGAQGGYMLSRPPKDISAGDILRSLEGEILAADCTSQTGSQCQKEDSCASKFVLLKLKDSVDQLIDSLSLEDMISEIKRS